MSLITNSLPCLPKIVPRREIRVSWRAANQSPQPLHISGRQCPHLPDYVADAVFFRGPRHRWRSAAEDVRRSRAGDGVGGFVHFLPIRKAGASAPAWCVLVRLENYRFRRVIWPARETRNRMDK